MVAECERTHHGPAYRPDKEEHAVNQFAERAHLVKLPAPHFYVATLVKSPADGRGTSRIVKRIVGL